MDVSPSLEIRKLPPSNLRELVQILEYKQSWKKLMSIIPKKIVKDNYIDINNVPKYNSEHFQLIESASKKYNKYCTEIFFNEWGTSGRVRPTLGHLLHLLVKAELFRAADYVAVKLLKQNVPKRPAEGPAASVTTALPNSEIAKIVDDLSYPHSGIENCLNTYNTNINNSIEASKHVVPKIVISKTPDNMPLNVPDKPNTSNSNNNTQSNEVVSDMIKFSFTKSVEEANVPNLNLLMNVSTESNLSEENSVTSDYVQSEFIIPENISEVMPAFSQILSNNIPNISGLLLQSDYNSNSELKSENIPNLSILNISNQSELSQNTPITNLSPNTTSTRRTCNSPLPNLSLNTLLPHFTFVELENATKNFDTTPHKNSEGRFLGSGAFGSVFLALGLLDRPIAVKKLHLNDVDVVNIDDAITKQFRNEVEVLCKYKHENLLSLVGYSCDGPTYCLMYEYISGGALKDRLQQTANEKLVWTDRLYIALGTAKAVKHLHTAFTNPLIHRDIKSANILLDATNKPKLCDFGLIKLTPNQNTNTSTTVFGTSAYMAPEAFRGDVSVKVDTFSFGVVLLELLTALPPLDEKRDGCDLVTHVEEYCETGDITPLLDKNAGSWLIGNENFGNKLFKIACKCLEEKKKRPNMVETTSFLTSLLQEVC